MPLAQRIGPMSPCVARVHPAAGAPTLPWLLHWHARVHRRRTLHGTRHTARHSGHAAQREVARDAARSALAMAQPPVPPRTSATGPVGCAPRPPVGQRISAPVSPVASHARGTTRHTSTSLHVPWPAPHSWRVVHAPARAACLAPRVTRSAHARACL